MIAIYFKKNFMDSQNLIPPSQPKNWLVESILVTILCCLPFGIVGIINAAQVSTKYASGDYAGAERASQEAGKWTKIGFWIGIAVVVLYVLAVFFFGATAFWMSSRY
jgi:heme/copper-type cytochrome/quinol oxidase subunit 2